MDPAIVATALGLLSLAANGAVAVFTAATNARSTAAAASASAKAAIAVAEAAAAVANAALIKAEHDRLVRVVENLVQARLNDQNETIRRQLDATWRRVDQIEASTLHDPPFSRQPKGTP